VPSLEKGNRIEGAIKKRQKKESPNQNGKRECRSGRGIGSGTEHVVWVLLRFTNRPSQYGRRENKKLPETNGAKLRKKDRTN